jgi:hemolysin III
MAPDVWFLSLGRDPFSMASHLLGAIVSLVATVVLVRRARRNGLKGRSVGVYGLMMTLAFSASALFHYVAPDSPHYELYNKLDHVAIFLMIAGTGTAIYGALQTQWANRLTSALWGCALLGILLKLAFWSMPDWLTAATYLTVGWLGCLGVLALGRAVDGRPTRLFMSGACVFTMSAVVYAAEWPTIWTGVVDAHGVFHVLVLLGAAFHYGFVYRHCTVPMGTTNSPPAVASVDLPQMSFDLSEQTVEPDEPV